VWHHGYLFAFLLPVVFCLALSPLPSSIYISQTFSSAFKLVSRLHLFPHLSSNPYPTAAENPVYEPRKSCASEENKDEWNRYRNKRSKTWRTCASHVRILVKCNTRTRPLSTEAPAPLPPIPIPTNGRAESFQRRFFGSIIVTRPHRAHAVPASCW
jgi:hypothetical protein